MKKIRDKEGSHLHSADELQGKSSPANILVFLVLATFLLAVSVCSSIQRNFFQQRETTSPQNIPNKYVWITGSSALSDGLYLFTPEQLEKKYPGLLYPSSEKSGTTGQEQTVFAIQYKGDSPEAARLPPMVASIFSRPISLNRADKNILTTLPGIGPVLAERIVQRRKELGSYRTVDELLQVTGIGPGKLARMAEYIFIDE